MIAIMHLQGYLTRLEVAQVATPTLAYVTITRVPCSETIIYV